jgi:hypothetical protein
MQPLFNSFALRGPGCVHPGSIVPQLALVEADYASDYTAQTSGNI